MSRWNHNTHYHPVLLRAVPPDARSALDVGCGEGTLARDLARCVPAVTGIDADPASIAAARAQGGRVDYVLGDVLEHPFGAESFDVVTSVATLHHLDARRGLIRLRALLRPGGTLAILGLARPVWPRDLPYEVAGVVAHRVLSRRRGYWEHGSPTVWPPPETYGAMRGLVADLLPGARFRRHPLWRYSVRWRKPAGPG